MIETRRTPRRRAVADLALLREPRGDMVRVVRGLKIIEMTANAGRISKVVVPAGMALATL